MNSRNLINDLHRHVLWQISVALMVTTIAIGQDQKSGNSKKEAGPVAASISVETAADGNEYFNATIVGGGPVSSETTQPFVAESEKPGWKIQGKVIEKHGEAKMRGDSVHLTLAIHHGTDTKKPVLSTEILFKPSEQIPKRGQYMKSGPGGMKGDWAMINLSKVARPKIDGPYEILSIRCMFRILDKKGEADPQIGLYFLVINGRFKKR